MDHGTPEVVQNVFFDALRHRVGLTYEAEAEETTTDEILRSVLERVPVPAGT
jgi:MoxR-like ATPase